VRQVTFIFATGTSWMDLLVTSVTKSRWSHAALRFDADNLLVEALAGKGLILQPGGKYDGWIESLSVPQLVPKQLYDEMIQLSRHWADEKIPYGYRTCLAIGMQNLFGHRTGRLTLQLLPGKSKKTLVCSEALVTLWRIAAPDFMAGLEARLLSPDEICQTLTVEFQSMKN